MHIKQFCKMIISALIIETLLFLSAILMGKWYIITCVYSVLINLISSVMFRIRPMKMGLIGLKLKGDKFVDILFFFASFIPIFNIIFSVSRYQKNVCLSDEQFEKKNDGKLILPKMAIKKYNPRNNRNPFFYVPTVRTEKELKLEYENVSRKKYKEAIQQQNINSYIDYIVLNKNLSPKQKQKILMQFRSNIVFAGKANLRKDQIIKLIKGK